MESNQSYIFRLKGSLLTEWKIAFLDLASRVEIVHMHLGPTISMVSAKQEEWFSGLHQQNPGRTIWLGFWNSPKITWDAADPSIIRRQQLPTVFKIGGWSVGIKLTSVHS